MADISNSEDTLDSREVEERITELQDEREALVEALKGLESDLHDAESEDEPDEHSVSTLESEIRLAEKALADWDASEEADELTKLVAFKDELEGYCPDWDHGTQLIRDSYFVEAMQELCVDLGDVPKDLPSYIVIDWNATADNLQADYTSGEFDGVTYWAR